MQSESLVEELRKVLSLLRLNTEATSCSLYNDKGFLIGVGTSDNNILPRMARLMISIDAAFKEAGLGNVKILMVSGEFGSVIVSNIEHLHHTSVCILLPKGISLGLASLAIDALQPELKRIITSMIGKQSNMEAHIV